MLKKVKENFDIKEILKFVVGGVSAVIVDALVYIVLKQYIDIASAKTISFILGAIVGFIINKFWTFKSMSFVFNEVLKYTLLYAVSAFANTVTNSLVLYIFQNTTFAFLCATGVSTVINFLGQKFIVFKKGKE